MPRSSDRPVRRPRPTTTWSTPPGPRSKWTMARALRGSRASGGCCSAWAAGSGLVRGPGPRDSLPPGRRLPRRTGRRRAWPGRPAGDRRPGRPRPSLGRIGREWAWTLACLGFGLCYLLLLALRSYPQDGLLYLMVACQGLLGYGISRSTRRSRWSCFRAATSARSSA